MNRSAQIYEVFGGVLLRKRAFFREKTAIFYVRIGFLRNNILQKTYRKKTYTTEIVAE